MLYRVRFKGAARAGTSPTRPALRRWKAAGCSRARRRLTRRAAFAVLEPAPPRPRRPSGRPSARPTPPTARPTSTRPRSSSPYVNLPNVGGVTDDPAILAANVRLFRAGDVARTPISVEGQHDRRRRRDHPDAARPARHQHRVPFEMRRGLTDDRRGAVPAVRDVVHDRRRRRRRPRPDRRVRQGLPPHRRRPALHRHHDRPRRQALRRHDGRRDRPLRHRRRRHARHRDRHQHDPRQQRRRPPDRHRPALRPGEHRGRPRAVGHATATAPRPTRPTGPASSAASAARTSARTRTTSSACRAACATTSRSRWTSSRGTGLLYVSQGSNNSMGAPGQRVGPAAGAAAQRRDPAGRHRRHRRRASPPATGRWT